MIATAAQHVSQMAEIQGAPASGPASGLSGVPALGEEFRVAFAASVGDNTPGGKGKTVLEPVAGKLPGDTKPSVGPSSSKDVQAGLPLGSIAAVASDEGVPVATRVNALAAPKTTVSSNVISDAKVDTAPAAELNDVSAAASLVRHFSSADSAPVVSIPQGQVDVAAGVPTTRVSANPSAKGTVPEVAGDPDVAGRAAASVPAASTAKEKESTQAVESAASRNRKGEASASNTDVTVGTVRQTISLVESLSVATLPVAAPAEFVLPLVSGQPKTAVLSPRSESIGEDVATRSAEPNRSVANTKPFILAEPASGGGSLATTAPGDSDSGKSNSLSTIRTEIADQTETDQVQAQVAGVPSAGRDAVSVIAVSGDNAVLHRSVSVSERLPVGGVAPAVISSAELDKNSSQQGASRSKSISFGIEDATKTGQPEKPLSSDPSTRVVTAEAGTASKQHSTQSNISVSTGIAGEAKVAIAGAPVAVELDAKNSTTSSLASDASAALAQSGASASASIAGQVSLPLQSLSAAVAAPQPIPAGGKERLAKRTVDDSESAASAQQAVSVKDNNTPLPNIAGNLTKDGVGSVAAVAGSYVTAPVAHAAAEALAVPVHAVSPAMRENLSPASMRPAEGLNGGLTADSFTVAQSGESHRTLLATPTALEVGVQSGTQGWLKIRAEVGGQGEVRASLDAVSTSGRDLLHSQLPALNAFLHNEQMSVTASVAERSLAPESGIRGQATGSSGFSGSNVSNGSLTQGGGNQRDAEQYGGTRGSEMVRNYDALGSVSDSEAVFSGLPAGTSAESGRWLNVRV